MGEPQYTLTIPRSTAMFLLTLASKVPIEQGLGGSPAAHGWGARLRGSVGHVGRLGWAERPPEKATLEITAGRDPGVRPVALLATGHEAPAL